MFSQDTCYFKGLLSSCVKTAGFHRIGSTLGTKSVSSCRRCTCLPTRSPSPPRRAREGHERIVRWSPPISPPGQNDGRPTARCDGSPPRWPGGDLLPRTPLLVPGGRPPSLRP